MLKDKIKEVVDLWQRFTIQSIKVNHVMDSGPRFLRTRPNGEIELIIIPSHVYEHLDSFFLTSEEAEKVWKMIERKI